MLKKQHRHSFRYLEGRIDELQRKLEEKDARLLKYTQKNQASNKTTVKQNEDQSSTQVTSPTSAGEAKKTIEDLEKLNESLNLENKKSMQEVKRLSLELKTLNEECELHKEKIDMMEKEQVGLDNLVR